MKKLFTVFLALGLLLVGCTDSNDTSQTDTETVLVKHDLAETKVPLNPKKVVVFDLGILETLDELDIEVIGLPKKDLSKSLEHYDDDKYIDVGTLFEPNYETLFELKPDLILMSARTGDHYEELSKIAPTVHLWPDNSDFLNSVFNIWKTLGEIFPDKAEIIKSKTDEIITAKETLKTKAEASQLNALMLMVSGSDLSVFGSGSRYGMIYDDFGLTQANTEVADSTHGENISFEYLVDVNPDIMIVLDRGQIVGADVAASDFLDNDLVNSTQAAKNNKVFYIDAEAWYITTSSIKSVQTMIEEISQAIK